MNKLGKIGVISILILIIFSLGMIFNRMGENEEEATLFVQPTVAAKKIKIAIMADIHNDREQFNKMLEIAKKDEVEMILVAGDLTNGGSREDLIKMREILVKSTLKYATVPGDHEKNLIDFKSVFGRNYQSINLGKVKLILIDNSSWHGLGEVQKKWIGTEVSDCDERVCIGIMHKVLNNSLSAQVMGENNIKVEAEADWLRELLIDSGVKRIEAGDLHYATSYELEGIRTDIVGAISRDDNTQSPRYTELVISEDLIERRVVEEEKNDTWD